MDIPKDFTFLDIQLQLGSLCMWAIVDPDSGSKVFTLKRYGTGWDMFEGDHVKETYLKTVQINNFVWHFFELTI